MRRAVIGATYVVPPLMAMLAAAPFVTGNWLFYPGGRFDSLMRDFRLLYLPFYMGMVAAPGYICLIFRGQATVIAPATRTWFRVSLALAATASAAGTILGIVSIFVPIGIPSLLTCIQSVQLFYRFERGAEPAAHWVGAAVAVFGSALFLVWFVTVLRLRP